MKDNLKDHEFAETMPRVFDACSYHAVSIKKVLINGVEEKLVAAIDMENNRYTMHARTIEVVFEYGGSQYKMNKDGVYEIVADGVFKMVRDDRPDYGNEVYK